EMPGLPYAKPARADDYLRQLHDTIDHTEGYVHTWDGELHVEFHRGTDTSQSDIKRINRRVELLYRETECVNVLQAYKDNSMASYAAKGLAEGWKIILRNQFHDIIPGSSINEVYKDAQIEHAEAEQYATKAWDEASSSIVNADSAEGWTVFNSAPWKRNDSF